MSVKRVAKRYVQALAELAQEMDQLDVVQKDMELFRHLTRNRDFFSMLKSPVIPHPSKKAVVKELLQEKISDLSFRFINLLITKERSEYLPEIAHEFEAIYRQIRHISSLKVTAAEPLSDAVVQKIISRLQSADLLMENVKVEQHTDADLIGGYVLEFGDFVYDASVKNQLFELKKDFSENLFKSQIVAR